MISLRTYQTWIKRSAELLDRDVPGWYKKINFDTLNMHDDKQCICGQLGIAEQPNPDYKVSRSYLDRFGLRLSPFNELAFSFIRGFHTREDMKIKGGGRVSDVQLRLWKNQINSRLKQEKV